MALAVDAEVPPFAFVRVEGVATIVDDAEDVRVRVERIAAREERAALAPAYGRRNGVPRGLMVRVTPTRIVAQAGVAE